MALKQVNLLLLWQHRQPVGNLPEIFDQAFTSCYNPLLTALEARPSLRLNFFYSGPLLEYLAARQPDYLDRLRLLTQSGRIEILGGAFYDPIFTELGERDRLGQIQLCRDWWYDHLGLTFQGAVCAAGGCWDQTVAGSLHEAGVTYTILNHERFLQAGLKEAGLVGYYITEHLGRTVALFPNHPGLRHLLPYGSLDEAFGFLRRLANRAENLAVTVSDHAERWGFWGNSHRTVLASGYLDTFLDRLAQSAPWLRTRTFSDYIAECESRGKIYPVPGVNWELGAWSLPPASRKEFFLARRNLEARIDSASYLPFFQAGSFSAFRLRYPESNQMWSKGLYLGRLLRSRSDPPRSAQLDLWRAQGSSAYWYAASGGIYLPHLREAIWSCLASAEKTLRAQQNSWTLERADLNTDGREDILLAHPLVSSSFDLRYGGACMELSWLDLGINLANVLSRKSEDLAEPALNANSRVAWGLTNAPASIEDWQRRLLFQDHWFNRGTPTDDLDRLTYTELGDFVDRPYHLLDASADANGARLLLEREGGLYRNGQRQPVVIRKAYSWNANASLLTVDYTLHNTGKIPLEGIFASELNLFLSSDTLRTDTFSIGQDPLHTLARNHRSAVTEITVNAPTRHLTLTLRTSAPAELWLFPLTSQHRTEGQDQILRQGNSLWLGWHEIIPPEGQSHRRIELIRS
ncbi:MAG: alpha-amylase/4-alpha-glucanotransferase domain-containing protein [Verrucomicrobiia bacterium]